MANRCSRLTWSMGNAVRNAALDARKQILDLVAQAWGEDVEYLDIRDGYVISYKTEEPCRSRIFDLWYRQAQ
jgi:CO/xanthine dehydrogenase Mo-binding subunit